MQVANTEICSNCGDGLSPKETKRCIDCREKFGCCCLEKYEINLRKYDICRRCLEKINSVLFCK